MPTACEVLQRNTWKRDTWRRTEHSASSQGANDDWDIKSAQDKSNVIVNTDQKGSCLSPKEIGRCKRQKFRDEDEANESKYEVENGLKRSRVTVCNTLIK